VAPDLLSNSAAWPQGIILEEAIERAIGPLENLYAAARAWLPIEFTYRLSRAGWLPPSAERQVIFDAFAREARARFPPFLRLLANGEWVARIRPWANVSAPFRLLQPEEVSQLSVVVHRDACSLELQGPDGRRLFALCYPKHIVPLGEIANSDVDKSENMPQTTAIRSNKDWLQWAVSNIPPDDCKHGWKKRYTEKLADRMQADAKINKKVKPLPAASIAARLNDHCLWPKVNEKTTN
jgi:hypothetical protein